MAAEADSYLKKETTSGGNQKTYTVSAWVKPTNYSYGSHTIFGSDVEDDGSNYGSLSIESDGLLKFINMTGGALVTNYQSSRKLRDATSWYHIVLRVDTTQGSAGDRIRLYVNGAQVTKWAYSTTPNADTDTGVFKSGTATLIGARHSTSAQNFWEGYMGHVHLVDGTSYGPDTFGEADSTTGEWKPILSPTVTYGTNGAFFKFEDSAALGDDSSGQGNDYTVTGTLKQSVSTVSNNFNTMDVNQKSLVSGYADVAYGATAVLGKEDGQSGCWSTLAAKKGKWYAEFKMEDAAGGKSGVGIVRNGSYAMNRLQWSGTNGTPGRETASNGDEGITYEMLGASFHIIDKNSGTAYGAQGAADDIYGMALDLTNGKIWFSRNGTWLDAPGTTDEGDPANGNYPGLAFTPGGYYWNIACTASDNGGTDKFIWCNFGEGRFGTTAVSSAVDDNGNYGSFEYTPPSGFYSLCTKNMMTYG